MNRKSIAQEYFVLAVNEKGNMWAMYREKVKSGIVAAGIMDLLLNGIIIMETKKITVIGELPEELGHIAPLYEYLSTKPRSSGKVMSDYVASTGSRIRQLSMQIGESLYEEGRAVKKEEGGLFGNKTVYIPEKGCKDEVIGRIRSAVRKDAEMDSHDMALIQILKETKMLNQYLSQDEKDKWKMKQKERKNILRNRQLTDMINYVDDMAAVVMVAFMVISCI